MFCSPSHLSMSSPPQLQQSASAVGVASSSAASSAQSAEATSSASAESSVSFRSLGLCPSLCSVAVAGGWKCPTALQRAVLPAMLSGRDILCLHGCGSGKKTAFGLALIHRLLQNPQPMFALIIEPSREMARQASAQLTAIGSVFGIHSAALVGGESIASQVIALNQQPHILVSTPGRLVNLLQDLPAFTLQSIGFFVIDEADRVIDQGFEEELRRILKALPKQRTAYVFATSLTDPLDKLQKQLLHDPFTIDMLGPRILLAPQSYLSIPAQFKDVYVVGLLSAASTSAQSLVFTPDCEQCIRLTKLLRQLGFDVQSMHEEMSLTDLHRALTSFRSSTRPVLVVTDSAVSSFCIQRVDMVISYSCPSHLANANRSRLCKPDGLWVVLVTQHDAESFAELQQGQCTADTREEPGSLISAIGLMRDVCCVGVCSHVPEIDRAPRQRGCSDAASRSCH